MAGETDLKLGDEVTEAEGTESTEPTTADQAITRLAALLGPPFGPPNTEGLTVFPSEELDTLSPERLAELDAIVDRAISLDTTDSKFGANLIELFLASLKDLAPEERAVFERKFVLRVLFECKACISQAPSFKELDEAKMEEGLLLKLEQSIRGADALMKILQNLSDLLSHKRESPLADIAKNVIHDQGSVSSLINWGQLYMIGVTRDDESKRSLAISELRTRLDLGKELLQKIYDANIAIVTGSFNLQTTSIPDCLEPVWVRVLNRNGNHYQHRIGQHPEKDYVTLDLNSMPEEIITDEAAIAIVLFNLLKNAVQKGSDGTAILIQGREVNGDCLELLVRDLGQRVDIKRLRSSVMKAARAKQQNGQELRQVEASLLDPHWNAYVPESALMGELFSRSISFSHEGDEGSGLAIVKALVQGLNGDVRIVNHLEGGVELRITLPNTKERNPIKRVQMVNAALFANLN